MWPGESLPGRIHHCHRYYGDGNRVPIEDAPRLEYEFEFAPPLSPNHKVYAEPRDRFTNDLGEQCPMAYWMRDGDAYLLFGLEGGP